MAQRDWCVSWWIFFGRIDFTFKIDVNLKLEFAGFDLTWCLYLNLLA
jgi:hypothetical protein